MLPRIMLSRCVASAPAIAVVSVAIDLKLQWTVAFMHYACFMHHKSTPRKKPPMSPPPHKLRQWAPVNMASSIHNINLTRSGHWEFFWTYYLWCDFLPLSMFWPFIHRSQPLLSSASMITIKRIPQRLHLSDPAMPAPPGMRSNFVNPNDLKTEGLILVIFCLTISTFVVSMRMWTKIRLLRKVVLEDCNSTFFRSSL